ncbi:MAG: PEP-utilizing enzyme [Solirubrobacteraceae bacterium]|nr:PEP-utilizing enzyme [Solirubrobacteraceae bacterium]
MAVEPDLHQLNPMHLPTGPRTTWTSVNTAETMPGVMSPLGWSFFLAFGERGTRGSFADLGVLSADEVTIPDHPDDRVSSIFLGRFVANVDTFRRFADRIPGTAGDDFETQIFGSAREGVGRPTKARWPHIAVRAPASVALLPRRMRSMADETHAWWRRQVTAPVGDGRAQLRLAVERTEHAMRVHVLATFVSQGLFGALEDLAGRAGDPGAHLELSTGYGDMEETDMVHRLWRVAHRGDRLEDFLAEYGFHGPEEGEISVRSWREQPSIVEAMVDAYRRAPGQPDPRDRERAQRQLRERAEARVLAGLDRVGRARARALIGLSRRYVPLREVGKAALHKGFDGARSAARNRGAELVAQGVLRDVDDVFLLTLEEIVDGPLPTDLDATIEHRRALRDAYRRVDVPRAWQGEPEPVRIAADADVERVTEVRGTGASHGVAEGIVRVCRSAEECDALESGEVLVTRATNPGWASAFPLVSALVVDIGSPGSHAAIISREMGLPCVIGTDDGSVRLRTGDRVRVDGSAGVVTILEPVAATATSADDDAPARPADDDGSVADAHAVADRDAVAVAVADADPVADPDPVEIAVVRLLGLKGRAGADVVATTLALDPAVVGEVLDRLVADGRAKAVRDAVRLTPEGRTWMATALDAARGRIDGAALEDGYERFHEPNSRLKELMTRWQTRGDDADEAAARDAVLRDLAGLQADVAPLVADLATLSPVLETYPRRLQAAADAVAAGDESMLAAPLADSFHTVWFELHEDLIVLLGRTREDEAAAGRAV